jgi:hypothetical protein
MDIGEAGMPAVLNGRWTARLDEPHVVFIIGMRINKPWKVHRWGPVAAAMPRMLKELAQKPELGFLGGRTWFARTIVVIQYWRSFDALEAYAKSRDSAHLPAWAAFNKAVGSNGDVGIFHETYAIDPGAYETFYANMPPTLFGQVGRLVEAKGALNSARQRLARDARGA